MGGRIHFREKPLCLVKHLGEDKGPGVSVPLRFPKVRGGRPVWAHRLPDKAQAGWWGWWCWQRVLNHLHKSSGRTF